MPETAEQCKEHPDGRPVAKCLACGKTVCTECVRIRGYFCSEACKSQLQQDQPPPTEEELKQQEKFEKQARVMDAVLPDCGQERRRAVADHRARLNSL
jgi:hypothetical protein